MLKRLGWIGSRTTKPTKRARKLRLEVLEQRAVLATTVDLFGLFSILSGPDTAEPPEDSPMSDGWDEGEDLIISDVEIREDGELIPDVDLALMSWTYVFQDDLFDDNIATYEVPLGQTPNTTIDWQLFSDILNLLPDFDGTPSPINVTLTGQLGSETFAGNTEIVLWNADPTIALDGVTPDGGCGEGVTSATITATLSDPNLLDVPTLVATVDWGDGTIVDYTFGPGDVDEFGKIQFSQSHPYDDGGPYVVTLTVTDDDHLTSEFQFDSGQSSKTYNVTVGSGGPSTGPSVCFDSESGLITVTGETTAENAVFITSQDDGAVIRVSADFLPGPDQFVDFPAASVTRIIAVLGAGDDVFAMANNLDIPVVVSGGAGSDIISSGRGPSILIGGADSDTLHGRGGTDLLIGGTTDHDNDTTALLAILAEWTSGHTLEERVRNIVDGSGTVDGGENDAYYLTDGAGGTVHDDGATDWLLGGGGTDWLFLNGTIERLLVSGWRSDLIGDDLEALFG